MTMPLGREEQHVELFDRGGTRRIGVLDGISRLQWNRLRDTPSEANVIMQTPSARCIEVLTNLEPNRTEMVIFRGTKRVWEGPVTRVQWSGSDVRIYAMDIGYYLRRTIMRSAYNNNHPNTTTVIQRMVNIITTEFARKEAPNVDPPYNVLPFLDVRQSATDTRTARATVEWEYTVLEHLDELAARAGLDYTVLGRSLILFDTRNKLGQMSPASAEDFIGDIYVSSYGLEGATFAAVTDGLGNAGTWGGTDPYYGLIEILDTAYDETQDEGEPPSVAEMTSQAQRNMANRNPTPIEVRIPDGSQINPDTSVFTEEMLVPGVWVPLRANLPGRRVSQMQKLDEVRVEYGPDLGETFRLVLTPAPTLRALGEDP